MERKNVVCKSSYRPYISEILLPDILECRDDDWTRVITSSGSIEEKKDEVEDEDSEIEKVYFLLL